MIIKLLIDLKHLTSFIYLLIKETLSMTTFRKIFLHIVALFIYSIFAFILTTLLILLIKSATIGNIFHRVDLDMQVSNSNIYSFITFLPKEDIECEKYMPTSTCDFVKDNAQYVNFNMRHLVYEMLIEVIVVNSGVRKNFYYDLDLLSPDPSRQKKLQGMIIPPSRGLFSWFYKQFINEEEIFTSKPLTIDFRFDKRPRMAVISLKELKDETFVKDVRIHIDVKTNFLMKFLKNHEFIASAILFTGLVCELMVFYLLVFWIVVVIQLVNFYDYVRTKHRKTEKQKQRKTVIPRIFSVLFPITKRI